MRKVFKFFDEDDTGTISLKNLQRMALDMGERIRESDLLEMIAIADTNCDGEVNEEEFIAIMKQLEYMQHERSASYCTTVSRDATRGTSYHTNLSGNNKSR